MQLGNNEYIKPIFLDAQLAFSDLEYGVSFTPESIEAGVKKFYYNFNRLYNCTKYLIKKAIMPERKTDVDDEETRKIYETIENVDKWFANTKLDKIQIQAGKTLFKEYSWLVVNNLF